MKQIRKILASLAVALVLGMAIVPAWSYFTASSEANGGFDVKVEPSTDIREWVKGSQKGVVITNDEKATSPVYVRVGVFTSLELKQADGNNWSGADGTLDDGYGWYYYSEIVQPGGETEEFLVDAQFPRIKSATDPNATAVEGDTINVIVVYESTPVLYDADGKPYADWSLTANKAPEGGN